MENKIPTVEEKQRVLMEQAVEASKKAFTAFREALKWSNRCVQLGLEESELLASVRYQWKSPEPRIFSRRSRLMPMCPKMPSEPDSPPSWSWHLLFEMNELPLDEMEADARAAREEMLAMKNSEEWKQ